MSHDILGFISGDAVLGNMPCVIVVPLEDHEYQYILELGPSKYLLLWAPMGKLPMPRLRKEAQMISRGIATFLGTFTLLNLLGNLFAPGFDANLWWIDLSPLPAGIGSLALFAGGVALLAYAIHPPRGNSMRLAIIAPITVLIAMTLQNAAGFYSVLHRHFIATSIPVPFSALVFLALNIVLWRVLRPGVAGRNSGRIRVAVGTFVACMIAFPMAQMFFFGHTDYRRKADAIVVFGARAYADGTPSNMLAERVLTGCQLYRDGLAETIVFSGGPGDGAIDEPHAMRRLALSQGVPDSAIRLDPAGLNTDATVRNTIEMFRREHLSRVLAVSHFYHLPRIKMAYRQAGCEVYTVPATEHYPLPGGGRFLIARELAALWTYYLHPLRR